MMCCAFVISTEQKMKFSIMDFFSKCDHGFGHICWSNPQWKLYFLYSVFQVKRCLSFNDITYEQYNFEGNFK